MADRRRQSRKFTMLRGSNSFGETNWAAEMNVKNVGDEAYSLNQQKQLGHAQTVSGAARVALNQAIRDLNIVKETP